jgi:hypothetical protein
VSWSEIPGRVLRGDYPIALVRKHRCSFMSTAEDKNIFAGLGSAEFAENRYLENIHRLYLNIYLNIIALLNFIIGF